MRHILTILCLFTLSGCADPVIGPTLGTAEVSVHAIIPKKLVIMPNLKVMIDIAGNGTEQVCYTNWHKNECKANSSHKVHTGDTITISVERALCVAYDCEILEKTYTVTEALSLQEQPAETGEVNVTATIRVTPTPSS